MFFSVFDQYLCSLNRNRPHDSSSRFTVSLDLTCVSIAAAPTETRKTNTSLTEHCNTFAFVYPLLGNLNNNTQDDAHRERERENTQRAATYQTVRIGRGEQKESHARNCGIAEGSQCTTQCQNDVSIERNRSQGPNVHNTHRLGRNNGVTVVRECIHSWLWVLGYVLNNSLDRRCVQIGRCCRSAVRRSNI